ncbi:PREDICTED: olfactory receptor 1020-like [Nanorana parkeri]|uniref:olfactory receptor 1020-like n=1 Tax=Nanorana parkeri TaxID=125878 RepID=UPI0008548822|nr:PREDICTED: olfactory receptor 1020-like [Nanorana parkeri]
MENVSKVNTNFVLVGLVEMENLKYLYSLAYLIIYVTTLILCSAIILFVWLEEKLHEPMYIFIGNLVLNAMVGSSAVFPKLVVDLLIGFTSIQITNCLFQSFFIETFAYVEILTFTIMAYDRYLAVGHPLQYPVLMTNGKAVKSLAVIWIIIFTNRIIGVVLTARLPLCGIKINSVYCETMSLTRLACGDTTVNAIYGTTGTQLIVILSMLIVVYCYIRTFLICLKISTEAYQKAIHTLVTHIVAFSTYMAATLFVAFRYRLNIGSVSTVAHTVISMTGLTVSVTFNPVIYGVRTEALRIKMVNGIKRIHILTKKK